MGEDLLYLFLTFIASYTWFYGLYDYMFKGYTLINQPTSQITFTVFLHDLAAIIFWFGGSLVCVIIVLTIIAFVIGGIVKIVERISKIKIAKCKLKDEK